MKALEFDAEIDERCRLDIQLPSDTPRGPVKVLILLPELDYDEVGIEWENGIAREWQEDLADERQDIYTLDDGEPVYAGR